MLRRHFNDFFGDFMGDIILVLFCLGFMSLLIMHVAFAMIDKGHALKMKHYQEEQELKAVSNG